jgi:hypothetical protein
VEELQDTVKRLLDQVPDAALFVDIPMVMNDTGRAVPAVLDES